MICLFCGSPQTSVNNSRTTKKTPRVWRRRTCKQCRNVFTTIELADLSQIKVSKRSGKKQSFSRPKLFISIFKSIEHLPKPAECAEALTSTITSRVLTYSEITSEIISEQTMKCLKNFDISACVKYASLQTRISSPRELNKTLKSLNLR